MHPLYLTTSARYYRERIPVRGLPWKSLGLIRRATNRGESGFGKASDRAEAKDHRPQGFPMVVWWGAAGLSVEGEKLDRCSKVTEHRPRGIPVGVWWGALSTEGRKLDRCSKVIIGFPVSFPSALIKC